MVEFRSCRSTFGTNPIADAANRLDELRFGRIVLKLFPKPTDVHVDGAEVTKALREGRTRAGSKARGGTFCDRADRPPRRASSQAGALVASSQRADRLRQAREFRTETYRIGQVHVPPHGSPCTSCRCCTVPVLLGQWEVEFKVQAPETHADSQCIEWRRGSWLLAERLFRVGQQGLQARPSRALRSVNRAASTSPRCSPENSLRLHVAMRSMNLPECCDVACILASPLTTSRTAVTRHWRDACPPPRHVHELGFSVASPVVVSQPGANRQHSTGLASRR